MTEEIPFWERAETVERFSGREPDHRLKALVPDYPEPARVRVLDLGCAGGRNTVFLAERGFDVVAVDRSAGMVAETRRRLAEVIGADAAEARVVRSRMDDLAFLESGSVDLAVAFGVLHCAGSREEWDRALAGLFRVLRPGGRLLVSNHTDEADVEGTGLVRIESVAPIYRRRSGRSYLIGADALDREMDRHGFTRLSPTETVRRDTDAGGVRVTANGFYGRPD